MAQLKQFEAPASGISFTVQRQENHAAIPLQLKQQVGTDVIQAKTKVNWTSQNFPYVSKAKKIENAVVGHSMKAELDPDQPVRGNDASSTHQKPFYESLKKYWNPGSKAWVRGHLLNANLGGPNVSVNLFPITGHANGDHLNYVENHVKKWIIGGRPVNYNVTAERETGSSGLKEGLVDVPNAKGSFTCYAETTDDGEKQMIYRKINSVPVAAGFDAGHASNWVKGDLDQLADEVDLGGLSEAAEEVLETLMDMSSDEMIDAIEEEIEELNVIDKIGVLKAIWGDEYDWEDELDAEDTENDTPGGKVLNDKLGDWLNHKKLTKKQAEQWMVKNHKGGNDFGVSS